MEEGLEHSLPKPPDEPLTTSEVVNKNLHLVFGADIVNESSMVFKTRCKLCNSPFRQEAEALVESGRPVTEVKTFLDGKGESIALKNIHHHFKEHFKNQERVMMLMDYCDNLAVMLQNRRNKLEDLELLINIGKTELMRSIGLPTGGDFNKEKERQDLIQKAQKMVSENIKIMSEMQDADAKVQAVYVGVVSTFKLKMDNSKSEEEKKMWRAALLEFQHSMPNIGGS